MADQTLSMLKAHRASLVAAMSNNPTELSSIVNELQRVMGDIAKLEQTQEAPAGGAGGPHQPQHAAAAQPEQVVQPQVAPQVEGQQQQHHQQFLESQSKPERPQEITSSHPAPQHQQQFMPSQQQPEIYHQQQQQQQLQQQQAAVAALQQQLLPPSQQQLLQAAGGASTLNPQFMQPQPHFAQQSYIPTTNVSHMHGSPAPSMHVPPHLHQYMPLGGPAGTIIQPQQLLAPSTATSHPTAPAGTDGEAIQQQQQLPPSSSSFLLGGMFGGAAPPIQHSTPSTFLRAGGGGGQPVMIPPQVLTRPVLQEGGGDRDSHRHGDHGRGKRDRSRSRDHRGGDRRRDHRDRSRSRSRDRSRGRRGDRRRRDEDSEKNDRQGKKHENSSSSNAKTHPDRDRSAVAGTRKSFEESGTNPSTNFMEACFPHYKMKVFVPPEAHRTLLAEMHAQVLHYRLLKENGGSYPKGLKEDLVMRGRRKYPGIFAEVEDPVAGEFDPNARRTDPGKKTVIARMVIDFKDKHAFVQKMMSAEPMRSWSPEEIEHLTVVGSAGGSVTAESLPRQAALGGVHCLVITPIPVMNSHHLKRHNEETNFELLLVQMRTRQVVVLGRKSLNLTLNNYVVVTTNTISGPTHDIGWIIPGLTAEQGRGWEEQTSRRGGKQRTRAAFPTVERLAHHHEAKSFFDEKPKFDAVALAEIQRFIRTRSHKGRAESIEVKCAAFDFDGKRLNVFFRTFQKGVEPAFTGWARDITRNISAALKAAGLLLGEGFEEAMSGRANSKYTTHERGTWFFVYWHDLDRSNDVIDYDPVQAAGDLIVSTAANTVTTAADAGVEGGRGQQEEEEEAPTSTTAGDAGEEGAAAALHEGDEQPLPESTKVGLEIIDDQEPQQGGWTEVTAAEPPTTTPPTSGDTSGDVDVEVV